MTRQGFGGEHPAPLVENERLRRHCVGSVAVYCSPESELLAEAIGEYADRCNRYLASLFGDEEPTGQNVYWLAKADWLNPPETYGFPYNVGPNTILAAADAELPIQLALIADFMDLERGGDDVDHMAKLLGLCDAAGRVCNPSERGGGRIARGGTGYKPVLRSDGTGYKPVLRSDGTGYKPVLRPEGTGYKPVLRSEGTGCKPVLRPEGTGCKPVLQGVGGRVYETLTTSSEFFVDYTLGFILPHEMMHGYCQARGLPENPRWYYEGVAQWAAYRMQRELRDESEAEMVFAYYQLLWERVGDQLKVPEFRDADRLGHLNLDTPNYAWYHAGLLRMFRELEHRKGEDLLPDLLRAVRAKLAENKESTHQIMIELFSDVVGQDLESWFVSEWGLHD